MKFFIIHDSNGIVWERGHTSLQSVIDAVSVYVEQENLRANADEYSSMKMETEFKYKFVEGSVLVAHNPLNKFCIFFTEVTI